MLGLTLTLAALVASASATGYIDGREYVYKYTGQIYSGYPRIKPQESGYAFHAKVVIQPHGESAIVQVTDVENAQFNGEFENVRTHPHEYHALPDSVAFLSKPFKVYRKHGVVTHFEVSKGEPTFSVNMKRGLVSLFNLNFDETHAVVPSTEDNDLMKPELDSHYYKVYEKGVLGDCETAYIIGHHPYYKTPQNNIVLNVTKVRNYHKCKSFPNQVYGVFQGHACGEAEHEKPHTLHGNAQVRYNIRGYRHHYIIETIDTVGELAYTPYPEEGQTVSTHINRHLELIEEHPVATEMELDAETDNYDSLEYDFHFQHDFKDPVDLHKPHYLFHLTGRKTPIDTIKTQFDELIHMYEDETYHKDFKDKNFPAKFIELLKSLGSVGYEEIDTLYHQYGDIPKTGATEDQKRYRNLFVDALVNLGTNPAILYAKELIESKKLKPQEASYFFSQLPLHTKEVSQTLLDALEGVCENENVKKYTSTYVSCILGFSTLVGERCVSRYHPEMPQFAHEHSCHPEDAVKYFESIAAHYQQSKDETIKMAYMKAAGNIGLREIIPYLKPYIEGYGNQNLYFRTNAVYAIVSVGFRFPEKVREILVPVLFNQTENYEIRIAAMNVLLMYRPALYGIEALARELKHDHDDQLRSYAYSRFQHMANSTHPCDRKSAKDAHYALRILEEVKYEFDKYDYSYSKHFYAAGYDHDYDFGGSSTFGYLASDTGYIPRALYLGLEDFIGGKSTHGMGVGFKQHGLEKFFDKLVGPEGTLGRRSIFDLFKKRARRDASGVEKELNEIKTKINIPVVEYEDIHGEFFYKANGRQHSFFHFDDKTFESFFKEGRFSIPNLPALYHKIPSFYYQRFMLPVDKMYVIPTESGVPLVFDYKQALYYYHHNKESSLRVEPGFFAEERGGKWPDHVKVETDGHIAVDKHLFASMGVIMPFDHVIFGAGINRRATLSLPLKLKMDLDEKDKSLHTKWTPVAPHEVYHFKYEPFTFVDSYDNAVPKVLEPGYHPVHTLSQKTHDKNYLHDVLGVGFHVHANYENDFNDLGSWRSFFYDKDYREKFYYLYANPHFEPYCVDIHFTEAEEHATKEVETTFKYHSYNEDHSDPEFATEGFEDYKIAAAHPELGPYTTCEVEFDVIAHGDKERKAHASMSWTRDLKRTYHKLNFHYDRTPFGSHEEDHLKICSSAFLKYPHYDLLKLASLDTIDMDHTVDAEITARFGKDCKSDQRFTVKGQFFTTEEQRHLEAEREVPDTPEHYNPYAHAYQRCLQERAKGLNYGDHCMEYFEHVTTVHGYHFYGRYENLSPRFLNMTHRLQHCFKHFAYPHADYNYPVENPENEFQIHANFSVHLPVGDIRVNRRHVDAHYTHLYMPHYHGLRSYPEFEDMHVKNSAADVFCKLEGDHVFTFDRYEYTLPPIDCYKVVAKDCSPNELFTVLGTKITHPKYHKAIRVFLGHAHKIEALPVSDDSDIIIRVDGKRVPVTEAEPYLHYETEDHSHGPDFYVTNRGFYYALHSEKYGVIVEYDGHNIVVQVSPFYRHKACGLCGNYNGQKYDGLETSEGCFYEDEKAYAYAWAIPSDTCTVPEFHPKCPHEGGFGCTKLRTKIVELTTGKVPQTCFSTEPIAECSSHCKASSTSTKHLTFHCLPAKDDSTKALVRQQPFRVIKEVRRKSHDHEAEVEVPDMCLKP